MARPKQRKECKTAREKMCDAFWVCIDEGPYDKLTVARIVREAGLNRNSFYYHFEDIDSMARNIVTELLDKDFLHNVFAQFHGQDAILDVSSGSDLHQRIDRMCLIAGDNSSVALQKMLRDVMSEIWSDTLGIDKGKLSTADRLVFEYNLGGIFAILGYRANTNSDFMIGDIVVTDFATNALTNMEKISQKAYLSR